ncbi:murein hydrolase activator EnvC family protein [Metallibacterium scheffleri]|nr:peptidoglycan DD-metalloendopeptidase family protein [Metallibacterium scheffleri]
MIPAPRARLAGLLLWAFSGTCLAAAPSTPPGDVARKQQEAVTSARLARIRQQIAALASAQQQTAMQRDALDGEIAQASQALAQAATLRAQTAAALLASQQKLVALQVAVGAQQALLTQQREALGALLRAAYALGPESDLRVLLGDADLAHLTRALAYTHYFQRQRLAQIRALLTALEVLRSRQAALAAQQRQLVQAQSAAQASDLAQREARNRLQGLRAQAAARFRDQGDKLAALAQQSRDLQNLLARLRDIFADIPKQLPGNVPFAQLRGHLPWPLRGSARAWQGGLLIAPGAHSKVRAVANGRVAYADWLRGFGMLVVVDQGDGWITLYGNNESLLVQVGDWVSPGQVIASAGTPAAGFDGVYFALRHAGQPVDPRAWLMPRP